MKKEINLEELFGIHFNGLHFDDITKENIVGFAVDACHQCLDLAAENTEITYLGGDSDINDFTINKNSILQIKDWIK
jgi:hypothetical protein